MKIRIKGDSVRFRLTQTEVRELSENGKIYDHTNFGNAKFQYGVILDDNIDDLQVSFVHNSILLQMPITIGKDWYSNDIITYENRIETYQGTKLYLLLEKDFTCLDNTTEDQSDNYPNPKLS